jgi:AraC-like DNA-binding protein
MEKNNEHMAYVTLMKNAMAWPPLPEASAAEWLNRAVQVAASLGTEDVVLPSSRRWGRLPRIEKVSVGLHPTYRPHAHSVNELCIALSGTAVMVLGEHRHRFDAPGMVVLEARTPHGEGRLGRHPYDLMWIGLQSEGAAYSGFSSYRPGKGWRGRFRQPLAIRGRRLLHRFAQRRSPTPSDWPRFQNELLEMLVELQTAALGGDVPTPPPAHLAPSVVADVQRYLTAHLAEPLRLDDVAHLVRMSPNYINARFRRETGMPIHAWILERRMEKSMQLCRQTELPIKTVAARSGFNDPLYFSKAFRRKFGISPTGARARGRTT